MSSHFAFCLVVAIVTGIASGTEVIRTEILTPEAAIAKHARASAKEKAAWPDDFRVTVEAAVVGAGERRYNGADGKPHQKFSLRTNGNPLTNFNFVLSENAVAAFHRLGIHDLEKHFVGKVITVRGILGTAEYNLMNGPKLYTLGIEQLDQIIEVRSIETVKR